MEDHRTFVAWSLDDHSKNRTEKHYKTPSGQKHKNKKIFKKKREQTINQSLPDKSPSCRHVSVPYPPIPRSRFKTPLYRFARSPLCLFSLLPLLPIRPAMAVLEISASTYARSEACLSPNDLPSSPANLRLAIKNRRRSIPCSARRFTKILCSVAPKYYFFFFLVLFQYLYETFMNL